MSEYYSIDDPEPPSGLIEYTENYQTLETYEGPDAVNTQLAENLIRQHERCSIGALCEYANELLKQTIQDDPQNNRHRITSGNATLTRLTFVDKNTHSYFFTVKNDADEYEYCRSWATNSDLVNWCSHEERHEPAESVQQKLRETFNTNTSELKTRTIAAKVLGLIRRP